MSDPVLCLLSKSQSKQKRQQKQEETKNAKTNGNNLSLQDQRNILSKRQSQCMVCEWTHQSLAKSIRNALNIPLADDVKDIVSQKLAMGVTVERILDGTVDNTCLSFLCKYSSCFGTPRYMEWCWRSSRETQF